MASKSYPQVAIDGPAGSGKSTVARRVAEALGYTYVDTGAMYRCVALAAQRAGLAVDEEEAIGRLAGEIEIGFGPLEGGRQRVYLNDEDVTDAIRTPAVHGTVSPISAIPTVRVALVTQQREIAETGPVVMEGRDIQTVVLPEADVKVFLAASVEVRARRRFEELPAGSATLAEVEANVRDRDARDSSRELAPLKPADDAVVIDTDGRSIDEVTERILKLVAERAEGI